MSEKELQIKLAKYLSKYFETQLEVNSTDGTSRIDIMLIHKSDTERKYPIGIEVKTDNKKRGKDLAEWLKQSVRYSTKDFVNYGKCLVVTYPQLSGLFLKEGDNMHNHESEDGCAQDHNVTTFLSMFGVGELQRYKRTDYKTKKRKEYLRIAFKGQIIWEEYTNELRINNYENLCKW